VRYRLGIGVGGYIIYLLLRKEVNKLLAFPLPLVDTSKYTFDHGLPPFPTEFVKSKTKLLQLLTTAGADIETVGVIVDFETSTDKFCALINCILLQEMLEFNVQIALILFGKMVIIDPGTIISELLLGL
jgi:hypothetical protein